jgi:cell wall-associated NlpC family hydrolase
MNSLSVLKILSGLLLLTLGLMYCKSSAPPPGGISSIPSTENPLRKEVVNLALQQQGKKYKYAGRDPRSGFDCSGLTYYAMGENGIDLPPVSGLQALEGREVPLSQVQPGDLVYFRRSPNSDVFHVSLVVANGKDGITVVHSVSRGVVVENISTSSYWKPKIAGARNVLGR